MSTLGGTKVRIALTLDQLQLIAAALEAAGETEFADRLEAFRKRKLAELRSPPPNTRVHEIIDAFFGTLGK